MVVISIVVVSIGAKIPFTIDLTTLTFSKIYAHHLNNIDFYIDVMNLSTFSVVIPQASNMLS